MFWWNKLSKKRYDSIQVKPSYIHVSVPLRILYTIPFFFLTWVFFLALYSYLGEEYKIAWLTSIALPFAVISASLPSLALLLSDWILRRLCKKWKYSRFSFIQRLFRCLIFETMAYFAGYLYLSWQYGQLPLWTSFITLALLGVLLASVVMADFFSEVGDGVLSLLTFTEDFKTESERADFSKLLLGAKRISEIAKSYNLNVSPYSLSLGMSISFAEKNEETQKDVGELIEWIQSPTKEENFKKFRKLVRKFNSIAKESSKEGITEKHHWSFESKIALLSAVVIPIAITIIAIVVPKLIEKYL